MDDVDMIDADNFHMDVDLGFEDYGYMISNGASSNFCSKKYMTPACNQFPLDSCVSHAVSAALGAVAGLTYNVESAPKFSTQEMVDCIPIKPGGIPHELGYEYVLNNGLHMEQDYPNLSKYDLPCRCPELQGLRKHSFEHYYNVNSEDVMSTLYRHPVTAAIHVYPSFVDYSSSFLSVNDLMQIYSPLKGERPRYDQRERVVEHAILVVGFGFHNNRLYYIIKNSWGLRWGVNGYARVAAHLLYHFQFPSIFRIIAPRQ